MGTFRTLLTLNTFNTRLLFLSSILFQLYGHVPVNLGLAPQTLFARDAHGFLPFVGRAELIASLANMAFAGHTEAVASAGGFHGNPVFLGDLQNGLAGLGIHDFFLSLDDESDFEHGRSMQYAVCSMKGIFVLSPPFFFRTYPEYWMYVRKETDSHHS